jgi:hypothetical protein
MSNDSRNTDKPDTVLPPELQAIISGLQSAGAKVKVVQVDLGDKDATIPGGDPLTGLLGQLFKGAHPSDTKNNAAKADGDSQAKRLDDKLAAAKDLMQFLRRVASGPQGAEDGMAHFNASIATATGVLKHLTGEVERLKKSVMNAVDDIQSRRPGALDAAMARQCQLESTMELRDIVSRAMAEKATARRDYMDTQRSPVTTEQARDMDETMEVSPLTAAALDATGPCPDPECPVCSQVKLH